MQTLEQIQIMHLCSAVFPTGAFSHSYGFETLFEEDKICNIEEYRAYLQAVLLSGNAKTDAGIIRFAYEHPEKAAKWDGLCTALKPTAELRKASQKTGNSFYKMFTAMYPETELLQMDFSNRNYAVVFAMAVKSLNLPLMEAMEGYLCGMVLSAIQVGIKLIPLSQADGQILMKECYETIRQVSQKAMQGKEEDLFAFAPMVDIASAHHEYQYSRMYMS